MKPRDSFVSTTDRYSLGVDEDSGHFYASIPVTTGVVDYEEYYELDEAAYRLFLNDPDQARAFIVECRQRKHDNLLMEKPGWNRGIAL